MKNCLSPQKFANLLFVNVRIRDLETPPSLTPAQA